MTNIEMFVVWLVVHIVCLKEVICVNMIGGSELSDALYREGLHIVKDPETTICWGVAKDEETVYTSSLCEVGDEGSVDSYHVAEHGKPNNTFKIKSIQRGKHWPFDLKVLKLESKMPDIPQVHWVQTLEDYNKRFTPDATAVVFGFGPPFKGGFAAFRHDEDCKTDYAKVKLAQWPSELPPDGLCIYPANTGEEVNVTGELVTIIPGTPCDDSVGSLVMIPGIGQAIGIVVKGFCEGTKVGISWGGYYIIERTFEPGSWMPMLRVGHREDNDTAKSTASGGPRPPPGPNPPPGSTTTTTTESTLLNGESSFREVALAVALVSLFILGVLISIIVISQQDYKRAACGPVVALQGQRGGPLFTDGCGKVYRRVRTSKNHTAIFLRCVVRNCHGTSSVRYVDNATMRMRHMMPHQCVQVYNPYTYGGFQRALKPEVIMEPDGSGT